MNQVIQMLIAAYLYKLINPAETDAQVAAGVTNDLKKFKQYLAALDKTEIEN